MDSKKKTPLSFKDFLALQASLSRQARSGFFDFTPLPEAIMLTLFSLKQKHDGVFVLTFQNTLEAQVFYSVSQNLFDGENCYLPGQSLRGVPGFVSESDRFREEFFGNLFLEKPLGLVFTTDSALGETGVPQNKNRTPEIKLSVQGKIKEKTLLDLLVGFGYLSTEKVINPGYYSRRGGILDVFLVNSRYPVRIELFGSIIESLRLYNPTSQRTIKKIDTISILPGFFNAPKSGTNLGSFLKRHSRVRMYRITKKESGLYSVFTYNENNIVPLLAVSQYSDSESRANKKNQHKFFFSKNIKNKTPGDARRVLSSVRFDLHIKNSDSIILKDKKTKKLSLGVSSRWSIESVSTYKEINLLNLSSLRWGEFVVHEDHGIGVYRGLEEVGGGECIKLKYKNGGRIYVPINSFDKIHRFVGSPPSNVNISFLGSGSWKRKKRLLKKHTENIAEDLIKTYSQRQRSRGFTYKKPGPFYFEVCKSFPYEETSGQLSAIKDVMSDLDSPRPMDRLICGDVGFGKTEVAIRASIRAIESDLFVFVLAPTTLLANQHFFSFSKRFAPLGLRVELLSRFKTLAQQKKIIRDFSLRKTEVLVGTHRLLSGDIDVERLGLVVVDEEHRFGVKQKEKIKSLKKQIDVLTLTATPIPRTLKQSLVGLKKISTITTPPRLRYPIKTFVDFFDWEKIYMAISLEIDRGGQVYFLHNSIETLEFISKKIISRFPKSSVGVAHGKMETGKLGRLMSLFFKNKLDILCCTTIIGSGIDVSNANTIFINKAHTFGLAQLYQIRGRVGRGTRQSFCYLLVPRGRSLSGTAFQRLKALEQNTSLGDGYSVALKDLDIRGAGDLFGIKQSGSVGSVGFHMYNKALNSAIAKKRGEPTIPRAPEVSCSSPCNIPSSYIPLPEDRLYFYQSLALADSLLKIKDIKDEAVDRFGPPVPSFLFLLYVSKIKTALLGTSLLKISIGEADVTFSVDSFSPFKSLDSFLLGVSRCFAVKPECVFLKNKKTKLQVKIETPQFSVDTLKKVYCAVESLFLNSGNC